MTHWGVWFDEIFSFKMIRLPVGEMISLGISDVHPFLYYFILKAFYKVLNPLNFNIIIVSLIPMYLVFALSLTKVRKNFAILTYGIFTLLLFSLSEIMTSSVEIRMYGWGLFFITVSFIYIYGIVKEPSNKNGLV